ncbi:YopT-type cysteine protease domain-containing protein [Pectobacterium actinidiae]|nr:YopT-type cysteine protease domain-containing protein [Pectobacterium actinidiae]
MRIHQPVSAGTSGFPPPAREAAQTQGLAVMQVKNTFTPLSQSAGQAHFSLRDVVNKLPTMPLSIALPATPLRLRADGEHLGKPPRLFESNLDLSCKENHGTTILMEQADYISTLKSQFPGMKKQINAVLDGACLGLSTMWLLGRHSGLDDHTVINNLLGYDADKDEITSSIRAKAGFEKVYTVQETFQNSARADVGNDKRFNGTSPVIRRYDLMQRISGLANMSVMPVAGETPFVLLNRREGLGSGLVHEVLRDGREQLLMVQSDAHAMALYSNGRDRYAFYDPNNGMFDFSSKGDFAAFMNRIGKMLQSESPKLGGGNSDMLMIMEVKIR